MTLNIDKLIEDIYPDCDPIAIIGHSGKFSKSEDNEEFWNNIINGVELSKKFSRQELLSAGIDASTIDDPNFVNIGSEVTDADKFDAELFGYSRQEAETIDPQQRIFLQLVWHALENAGYPPLNIQHKTGVFGSSRMSTYSGQKTLDMTEVAQVKGLQSLVGNDKDYLATRVAYKLNLKGPAISVQTACSSSLVATHMACESLRSGECDMAIAGGIAVSFPQQTGYIYQSGMIFSPDGRCRSFDKQAQGTFGANGGGVVVMRRLKDALEDGDKITSVILGSAINNDGSEKAGYTAPSVFGQKRVIQEAIELSDVNVQDIGLIEAHGTGTPLGDSIEVKALKNVFDVRENDNSCALGSVKSNLGHLDTAAGIASLIKASMAVEKGIIPPSLNFDNPNPELQLENSPFYIPTKPENWDSQNRIAGVSSFGIGGTNCHMIVSCLPQKLQEITIKKDNVKASASETDGVLLLSASSEKSLRGMAKSYAESMVKLSPQDLAYTSLHCRHIDMPYRLAVKICKETEVALKSFSDGKNDFRIHMNSTTPNKQVWLFTGQGSHWEEMAHKLYKNSQYFADTLDKCFVAFDKAIQDGNTVSPNKVSLREVMLGKSADLLKYMEYAQPAIVSFELAMASHWQGQGLKPDFIIGHSVGEFAGAVIAGYYELEPVIQLVRLRGLLMDKCPNGNMVSVFADEDTVMPIGNDTGVEIAVWNGENNIVFSGDEKSMKKFTTMLEEKNIDYRELSVTGAAHSKLLDGILEKFEIEAKKLDCKSGNIPIISTLLGKVINEKELKTPKYWSRHMREPVKYKQAVDVALKQGANVFIEMGPDAILTQIGSYRKIDDVNWIATSKRFISSSIQMEQALMKLYVAGIKMDWVNLLPSSGNKINAPVYHFDTQSYWIENKPKAINTVQNSINIPIEIGRQTAYQDVKNLEIPRLEKMYECITKLHAIYVEKLIYKCVGSSIEEGLSASTILRRGRILPRYGQLLVRLLNSCVEDGYFSKDGDYFKPNNNTEHQNIDHLLEQLDSCCEGYSVITEIVSSAGEKLYEMMTGEVEPVAIIFPESSSGGVEVLYQDFSFGRYFNQIATAVVKGIMQEYNSGIKQKKFKILEVGGGTGGTTSWILKALKDQNNIQYDFTDISSIFTRRAESKFSEYDFLSYKEFNIEKDPQKQGFKTDEYDLIIGANVIHATQDVNKTLANLYPLLKSGGRLLMRELTRPMRLFDFVFGPLVAPLHDEKQRDGQLFLTTDIWKKQCIDVGFDKVEWLPDDGSPMSEMSEHIILATKDSNSLNNGLAINYNGVDSLLGQSITNDGCYIANWSKCAGNQELWEKQINNVCAELASRHGHKELSLHNIPSVPEYLTIVSISYEVKPFKAPNLKIDACDNDGVWNTVLGNVDNNIENKIYSPATDTNYELEWFEIESESNEKINVCLEEKNIELTEALEKNGITVSDDGNWNIVVIPNSDIDNLELAEQVINKIVHNDKLPLIMITRSAWKIEKDEQLNISHHALWGIFKVVDNEQKNIFVIDINENADWQEIVPALSAIQNGHNFITVRNSKMKIQKLVESKHCAPNLPYQSMNISSWHVVTGAFGGLGLLCVEWLAQKGAKKIALLAPRSKENWKDLKEDFAKRYFCEIKWIKCDICDTNKLLDIMAKLQKDAGVNGVIHSAGVLYDSPISMLNKKHLTHAFNVKANSALFLHKWLNENKGQYLILFSSVASVLGSTGQSAHAFSSSFLDGIAISNQDNEHLKTISIAWGAWGQSGKASDINLQKNLEKGGMGLLSDNEGLWNLEQAIMRCAPYRIAMRIIPEKLNTVHRKLLEIEDNQTPLKKLDVKVVKSNVDIKDKKYVKEWITRNIITQLRISETEFISEQKNLMEMGLDSLLFLELKSSIKRDLFIDIDTDKAYKNLSIEGLSDLITAETQVLDENQISTQVLEHNSQERYLPFPLTPIQHSYWMGRTDLIEYGGVACQVVFEWNKSRADLDLDRFESAWNKLIKRHDMLRMFVNNDGEQVILPNVPYYYLKKRDLRNMTQEQKELEIIKTRKELAYVVLPADKWPLFELVVNEFDNDNYSIHMKLDLLMFDAQSFKVMMDDLQYAYDGEELKPFSITFRDYLLLQEQQRQTESWQKSWCYWQQKLIDLPPAPRLPLAPTQTKGNSTFTTHRSTLDKKLWDNIKRSCKSWGVTPSTVLMTLFAKTIERYSRQPEFTLNLTFFDRKDVHPEVSEIIGDFTSVLLIDFDFRNTDKLIDHIKNTQQKLWESFAHNQVNGVEIIRELSKLHGVSKQPLMPVVFTSMLGMSLDGLNVNQAITSFLGEPSYLFTQTPQVWLDHQIMEVDGDLAFGWYVMDGVLEEGIVETMFEEYNSMLNALSKNLDLINQKGSFKTDDKGNIVSCSNYPYVFDAGDKSFNLLEVEKSLRCLPNIRRTELVQSNEQLQAYIEVEQYSVNNSPVIVSPDELSKMDKQQEQEVIKALQWFEKYALQGICKTMNDHQLFNTLGQGHTLIEIQKQLSVLPKFDSIVKQWLSLLQDNEFVKKDGNLFVCVKPLLNEFESFDLLPNKGWYRTIAEYLQTCVEKHPSLLNGSQSPLDLLFGNNSAVANVFYTKNPVVQYLYENATYIVQKMIDENPSLNILEVGAGTGAILKSMKQILKGSIQKYNFTDVSTLFLDDAKKEFADFKELDFALFDINKEVDFNEHPHQGYDLIIANQVLHDSNNVVETLKKLLLLLSDSGRIIIVEATLRDSNLQAASIGFLEGIGGFNDIRMLDNKPMLDIPMWRNALEEAGFVIDVLLPNEEQSIMGQHLITIKPKSFARLEADKINEYINDNFKELSNNIKLHQCEKLHNNIRMLESNSSSSDVENIIVENSEPLINKVKKDKYIIKLENQIKEVWEELLSQKIYSNSDFFLSGGDSLIATRMIVKLNNIGIKGANLQILFKNSKFTDFCSIILESEYEISDVDNIVNILPLSKGSRSEKIFLFHTSSGGVTSYINFAEKLDADVYGVPAPYPLKVNSLKELAGIYVNAIRKMQHKGPYLLAGWSYGAFLIKEASIILKDLNEEVVLMFIDPICQSDFTFNNNTSKLRLLSKEPINISLPDYFDEIGEKKQINIFIKNALSTSLIKRKKIKNVRQWIKQIDDLLEILNKYSESEKISFPSLYISSLNRPSHWSPSEKEWQNWISKSEHHSLNVSHWDLMEDENILDNLAKLFHSWVDKNKVIGG